MDLYFCLFQVSLTPTWDSSYLVAVVDLFDGNIPTSPSRVEANFGSAGSCSSLTDDTTKESLLRSIWKSCVLLFRLVPQKDQPVSLAPQPLCWVELAPEECPRCIVMLPSGDTEADGSLENLSSQGPLRAAVVTKNGRLRYTLSPVLVQDASKSITFFSDW